MRSTEAGSFASLRADQGVLDEAYYFCAFWFCLLTFGVITLTWSLPAGLIRPLLPRRLGERLGQRVIMGGFRLFIGLMRATGVLRVDFREIDRLRDERGVVLACNHPTMLDAVLIASRLPRVVCILKASLWDNPFLGGGARLAGYVRNDQPLAMIRRAAGAAREGDQLLIFPEGTRTATPPIGPLTRSFALMAQRARVPVQTVLIEADSPYLRKGWPLTRRPVLPLTYRLRLGQRFPPPADAETFSTALEAYFAAHLPGPGLRP